MSKIWKSVPILGLSLIWINKPAPISSQLHPLSILGLSLSLYLTLSIKSLIKITLDYHSNRLLVSSIQILRLFVIQLFYAGVIISGGTRTAKSIETFPAEANCSIPPFPERGKADHLLPQTRIRSIKRENSPLPICDQQWDNISRVWRVGR